MPYKAYFFKDKRTGAVRRTPIYARDVEAARAKLHRPPAEYAVVEKMRDVTEAEHKAARNGHWVSSRVADDFEDQRGFGPAPHHKTDALSLSDNLLLHIDAAKKGKFEFTYDPKTGRYRYVDSGQFLSKAAFSHLTERHILSIKKELAGYTLAMLTNELSFKDWQRQSAESIRMLHLQQYLLGRGGAKHMGLQDMKIVRDELKFQVEKLRGFAQDIKLGKLSDAQIKARAGLYAASGKKSFARATGQAALSSDKSEYRNILNPGESCSECIEITNKGWVPIGSQKPIGDRTCLVNCNCQWEYRSGAKQLPTVTSERTDKAIKGKECGKSYISKDKECHPRTAGATRNPKVGLAKTAAAAVAAIAAARNPKTALAGVSTVAVAATVAALGLAAVEAKTRLSVDFNSIRKPPTPGGKADAETLKTYDTFKPGDLIRKNFSVSNGVFQHYGIYMGKDSQGYHLIAETSKKRAGGAGVDFNVNRIADSESEHSTQYEKVTKHPKAKAKFTTEEIQQRVKAITNQNVSFIALTSNCEAVARAIVEGHAYSTQADKVSPLSRVTIDILSSVAQTFSFKNGIGLSEIAKDKTKLTAVQVAMRLEERTNQSKAKAQRQDSPPANLPTKRNLYLFAIADQRPTRLAPLGLKDPQQYTDDVEYIVKKVPVMLKDNAKVALYRNYLMMVASVANRSKANAN